MTSEPFRGLDRVRKRPGLYTDTSCPNHLALEVIDNSVDEALAGHAKRIDVVLFTDGSCQVSDDGRGIPVDLHPKLNISAVELILTHLHSSAKSSDNAGDTSDVGGASSGGVRRAGVAVVNALSKKLEVRVCRSGIEYAIGFADGELTSPLTEVGGAPDNRTGTSLRFWPDERYFDLPLIAIPTLKQVLRAKAVLCPNLRGSLDDQINGEQVMW
jgi:topoisomerase-4 subunit B